MRQGPRPLPAHLAAAATLFATSNVVSQSLKPGSTDWNPLKNPPESLRPKADALAAALCDIDPTAFEAAVSLESRRRLEKFLTGVERYRSAPYQRDLLDPPVIWSEGSTRFLDYGDVGAPCVLLTPSLINRGYILDLSAECSFARWLATEGFRPILVDWGPPGAEEADFGLTDYITRLERGFDELQRPSGISILGYCMGGLLALALAVRRRAAVDRLALLATPWDFHEPDPAQAVRLTGFITGYEPFLGAIGALPVDVIQMLFFMLDPFLGERKFSAFATTKPEAANRFIALEDWLNDGVALTANVARDCLLGWYGDNAPARGEWRVEGNAVTPQMFNNPTYIAAPSADRIVPPESALAIASGFSDATVVQPDLGHIGMMTGRTARADVWAPLARWLRA
jgi:polyhydroxyalkanoate synthase